MMNFPVSIFGLAYATVGQRVASMVRIHPKIKMMTGVSHCQLSKKEKQKRNKVRIIIHKVNQQRVCGIINVYDH